MKCHHKRLMLALLAVLLALSSLLTSCSDPPVGEVINTDVKKYGKYNEYVKDILTSHFKGALPEAVPDNADVIDLYYLYTCAILGDPAFYIDLKIRFNDTESYDGEKERIGKLTDSLIEADRKMYYLIDASEDFINEYLDTETIRDGYVILLEIVVFEDSTCEVEYLTAQVWDAQKRFDHVQNIIEVIYPDNSEQQ